MKEKLKTLPVLIVIITVVVIVTLVLLPLTDIPNGEPETSSEVESSITRNLMTPFISSSLVTESLSNDSISPESSPTPISTPRRTKMTVDVSDTVEFFEGELYITLVGTTFEGNPLRYMVIARISAPGHPIKEIDREDVGYVTVYEAEETYEIRVISTDTYAAQFLVEKIRNDTAMPSSTLPAFPNSPTPVTVSSATPSSTWTGTPLATSLPTLTPTPFSSNQEDISSNWISCDEPNVAIYERNFIIGRQEANCHFSLLAGEFVVGDADRFQEYVGMSAGESPCIYYLIEGPIEKDLKFSIAGGGDYYEAGSITAQEVESELADKLEYLTNDHIGCRTRVKQERRFP